MTALQLFVLTLADHRFGFFILAFLSGFGCVPTLAAILADDVPQDLKRAAVFVGAFLVLVFAASSCTALFVPDEQRLEQFFEGR